MLSFIAKLPPKIGVQLVDPVVLTVLVTLCLAFAGWLLRLGYLVSKSLTRDEHDAICASNQASIKSDLRDIRELLKDQDQRARDHRDSISNSLSTIGTEVAVIKTRLDQAQARATRKPSR